MEDGAGPVKKSERAGEGGSLRQFRQERQYEAVRRAAEEQKYSVTEACRALHISRAGYYQWRSGRASTRTVENRRLAGLVKNIHAKDPDKGYRRIRDDLARYYGTPINDKRALRICRSLGVRSTIKYARHGCTRLASDPQFLAENVLDRQFYAEKPNEKWLTDVTEFKYYVGPSVHKLYLSAILDLYDRRIVSFVLRDANDSALVHETLDQALAADPDAHPLFHSDRGFQYTTRVFHDKLAAAGMTQSMSRVGKCIDNGPIEGFWGILKRERYYGRKFTSREQLCRMIREYIAYYNFNRLQRRLGVHTPMEVFTQYRAA
ncbi:IS3 family transposase [Faecalibaculum rodentium]|uniref:IS3 family transposase n=1 Tax=Faecalibaculum rodentium TaxID=1702221 RepID=UPI00338E1ED2